MRIKVIVMRFRRTNEEIERGLTPEQAKKSRDRREKALGRIKASLQDKVAMIRVLETEFGIDIASPSPDPMPEPETPKNKKLADINKILARIRRTAEEEVAKDPLLYPHRNSQ